MIKISTVEQENQTVIVVESNRETDKDELDLIYRSLMCDAPKKGGYTSSEQFMISVSKKKSDE